MTSDLLKLAPPTATSTSPVAIVGRNEIVGDIFTGTRGPHNAPIMVVGEAWGDTERAQGKPFVGASGVELERMLREAGIDPTHCFFTNLVNEKPNMNDMRYFLLPNERGASSMLNDGVRPSVRMLQGLQRLDMQIEVVKPRIIIATGNWPLWYLTGKANVKTNKGYKIPTGIDTWRGSQLFLRSSPFRPRAGVPVLPVYHPAAILRMYTWRQITVQDLRRAGDFISGRMSSWHDVNAGERWNLVAPKPADLETLIDGWIKQPEVPIICDLETKLQRIHIVGLTRDGKTNVAVPFFHITPDGFRRVYTPLDFKRIYMALFKLFTAPGMKFVGQNWLYDIQYITKFFHITPHCEHDTMIWQHVMFPSLRKGLDYLSSMYCAHHVYWKDDLKESTDTYDTNMACLYNCEDLYRTHEIFTVQKGASEALGKEKQFRRRMRLFPIVARMMNNGVLVDEKLKTEQRIDLFHTSLEISNWLEKVMPSHVKKVDTKSETPWYDSPSQLAHILYDRLKLKPIYDRKTGARSTGKEALGELAEHYPHFAGLFSAILLLRSVQVIAGNILSAPLESNGRMCTAYSLASVITYRLASSKNVWGGGGNMQNILRDREEMDLLEEDLT